ncbi:cyclin-D2-1-like [Gossypium australe]|uniref:Cyclin-D2-1-like n=1 Tax=Gossypium australe TaxID=47621 RepID=A0A5B6X4U9_9ROSI|nr:cyclin-D2-1-like [Gossypium australe]
MSLSHSHPTPLNNSPALSGSSTTTSTTTSSLSSCDSAAVELVTREPRTSSHNYPPSDEDTISTLIDMESHHMPFPDYLHRCQQRSIDAMQVHAYYNFSQVTAFLSVNYLDRFLSSYSLPLPNGWPFQLLSVACLSLAAKMEEAEVPLLLDLQLFEPRFFFEPETVQRMELRVMAALNWRLRSVTPFDYLHLFLCKLPSLPDSFASLLSASSDLILSTTRVIDFLQFAPSAMAAAAVFCAVGEGFQFPAYDAFFPESVNKEMVRSCHQLMEKYLIDTCPSAPLKEPSVQPSLAPPSPVGVLDAAACGSCDTRSSSSQLEPPAKRLRSSAPDVQQQ